MKTIFTILIMLSVQFVLAVDVDIYVRSNGSKFMPSVINDASPAQNAWMRKALKNGDAYYANRSANGFFHTPTGARATSTMPVVIEHQVKKKAVMSGLLANAKAGGKVIAGRFGWAGLIYTAYVLVEPKLKEAGFLYDKTQGTFVRPLGQYMYVYNCGTTRKTTNKPNTGTYAAYETWASSHTCTFDKTYDLSKEVTEPLLTTYCKTRIEENDSQKAGYLDNACTLAGYQQNAFFLTFVLQDTKPINQDEFDSIIIPYADGEPSEYVNLSVPSLNAHPPSFSYTETTSTSGSSSATNPYTDPRDGKAKQTKITINADGNTAKIEDTLRTDLQGNEELAPVPNPVPDLDNETKPEPASASTPIQCDSDKYPDSLGCVDTTEEIEDASMVIPNETVNLDFQVKNYITSSNGTCPQGSQFTLNFFSTHSYEFSFEPVCKFAEMIKYALWVCSWLIAYYIVIGRPE